MTIIEELSVDCDDVLLVRALVIDHRLERRPLLAFAVCYITVHYVFDLIDHRKTEAALDYCEENME